MSVLEQLPTILILIAGLVVWLFKQLVQRAWDHYERKYRAYFEVVSLIDALFEGGDVENRSAYLKAVRGGVWLVGSDDVNRAIKALHESIKANEGHTRYTELYSEAIMTMRKDLHRRSYFPPSRTSLSAEYFPVES